MTFRRLFFLACLFFPGIFFAQYNWSPCPNAPESWRLDDIYFLNPQMGWAISPYYGSSTPMKYGQIYRTNDGGNTWQLLVDSSFTYYRSIGFADSLTGWVGNLAFATNPDTIPFYQTSDGGLTWQPVTNISGPSPKGICGISVVTDSVAYAYGRWFGPAVLLKTTDKGNSWISQDLGIYASGLIDGYFFDKDTGFVTGIDVNKQALILSTYDGGASWQVRYQSARNDTDALWKISFPSRNVGYASIQYLGSNYPHATYFLKTTDGGITWTEHNFFTGYNEQGIGFINDTVGWIGGDATYRTYVTMDGGNSWAADFGFGIATPPYVQSTGYEINRFRKFGDTLMYASGNTVYKMQHGITSVNDFALRTNPGLRNYPNPFYTLTVFEYEFEKPENDVVFEIYNMMGEKVYTEKPGDQQAGQHEIAVSVSLAPGIYVAYLHSRNILLTHKIIVK